MRLPFEAYTAAQPCDAAHFFAVVKGKLADKTMTEAAVTGLGVHAVVWRCGNSSFGNSQTTF